MLEVKPFLDPVVGWGRRSLGRGEGETAREQSPTCLAVLAMWKVRSSEVSGLRELGATARNQRAMLEAEGVPPPMPNPK